MALPSFLQRKPKAPSIPAVDPVGDESAAVQQARVRARRRLIGAVVLLAIGVVVFPLVFETQPRPLPADVPIEVPRREGPPARVATAPTRPAIEAPIAEPAPPAAPTPEPAAVAASTVLPSSKGPEPAAEKPTEKPTVKPADKVASTPAEQRPDPKPEAKPEPRPEPRPPAPEPSPEARKAEAERARAALEGRAPAPAASEARGRFVVQVGAYTDPGTLRDVRAKVEKLGLKTYTQSVDTDAGKRTRVRVGPYATRQEADSASGKLKAAGLPGNVLAL